jgi:uncharacterized membrane protein YcaP (DUF421 family)
MDSDYKSVTEAAEEELMSLLRQQGIEDVARVKKCFLEADGHISIIKASSKQ